MVTKKQRRRQLARAKWERQQQRRAQRTRKRRRNSIVIGAALGVVIALVASLLVVQLTGDGSNSTETGAPTPGNAGASDVTASDDRFGGMNGDSIFQVIAPANDTVESGAGRAEQMAGSQQITGRYLDGVDRPEASVMIDKPKIAV